MEPIIDKYDNGNIKSIEYKNKRYYIDGIELTEQEFIIHNRKRKLKIIKNIQTNQNNSI
jgi:hypothetical protein